MSFRVGEPILIILGTEVMASLRVLPAICFSLSLRRSG